MPRKLLLSSSLVVVMLAATAWAQADRNNPIRMRKQSFDIAYRVNEAALPLDSVTLWYTVDSGQTWTLYGNDEDRQSPIAFRAPQEGLFGFFFVLKNAAGVSSADPREGSQAHHWVLVDFTPPVVQLHPLKITNVLGERVVQVRWTAIDAQLAKRPIQLEYRIEPGTDWHPASHEPLANTGRFDWRVPANMFGSVIMRVTVTDLGGHRVVSSEQRVDVTRNTPTAQQVLGAPTKSFGSPAGVDDTTIPGTRRARQRVEQLLAEAEKHRANGEYALGIARLREVVRLDPHMTDAFMAMGSMLQSMGDNDRALNAYDIALAQRPAMRDALLGSARVLRDQKNYGGAAERIRTVLRYDARDAEAWMNLGDVAIFQGDELLARECYTRAMQIDPAATSVIEEAKQRLAMMKQTSQTYRATNE